MKYEANWESLDKRPVPSWFEDAKFGIFIHWGIYSVPSYTGKGEYAEWYACQLDNPQHPSRIFHDKTYGPNFKYSDFAGMFKAELFNADEWAQLFEKSGAKYINFVTKNHDGFCMYDTDYAWNWNSYDVGPHRDFCKELKEALDKTDVKFGIYHSVYEWTNPVYLRNPEEYATEHLIPMLKELIEKYKPYTLFTDGEWDQTAETWHSAEFLQWLYNESSVKDYIVPNDRWGIGTRGHHGVNFTTEYDNIAKKKAEFMQVDPNKPFEECRGMGRSFGLNRIETTDDYMSAKELIEFLVMVVGHGGNLLLNIGPAADGTIPVIQQERLLQMGKWLETNGEAIYGSREYCSTPEDGHFYTKKGDTVYGFTTSFPFESVIFEKIPYFADLKVSLLGSDAKIETVNNNGNLKLLIPALNPDKVDSEYVYTFKIER